MTSLEITLRDPGLVENGTDGMSCLHACIQMVQRATSGKEVYSFEKINQILKRKDGVYSWEYAIFSELASKGYGIESYQLFDIKEFIGNPEQYLLDYYGEEGGKDQIDNSDLLQVIADAKKFSSETRVSLIQKAPTRDDLCRCINEGKYVVASINQRIIQADTGIVSHVIFIYGYSSRGIRFHNPGHPSTCGSEISWELFEKAWNRPSESNREMYSFLTPENN